MRTLACTLILACGCGAHAPGEGGAGGVPGTGGAGGAAGAVLQLLGAAFASSQDLVVRFDQEVDAGDAAITAHYLLSPALDVMAASVEEGGTTVHLRTAAAPPDTTFTLQVDQRLRAATGLTLGSSGNTAVFRSFDALPDPLPQTFTFVFGCAVGAVIDVKGLWADSHAFFLTDREGNQVQLVPFDGSISAGFLGSDGTFAGLHHEGTPAGCPGGDSQDEGALLTPVGAAVQEPAGSVLVADTGHGRLLRYQLGRGVEVVADKLASPALLGIFGGDAWVAEPGRILQIALDGGHEPIPIGEPGSGDLQFGFATDDARVPAASSTRGGYPMLIVEPGNQRVQRLASPTSSDGSIGTGHEHGFAHGGHCCFPGSDPGQLGDPRGVQMLASGAFYVIDGVAGGRLQKFDPDGKPVRQMTLGYEPFGMVLLSGFLAIAELDGAIHTYVP